MSASPAAWAIDRLVLYASGRAEAAFSDGSGAILHPPSAAKVTFFTSEGHRQRLLSTCLPRCGRKDLRAKIMAAAAVRDQFHPRPSCLSCLPAESERSYGRAELSRVAWQSLAEVQQDGSVRVSSLDGSAHVVLAPHGRTFAVEWLRPTGSSSLELQSVAADGDIEQQGPHPRLFHSADRAAGLSQECVRSVQCFPVEEPIEVAWVYPVLMALLRHDTSHQRVRLIKSLADTLRQCLASGSVLESGSCVTAPLPHFDNNVTCHSSDDISPAACMGTFGEGLVMLSWTPQSAVRLGREASVEAFDSGSSRWAFLESSLGGRFWKLASANMDWQLPDVLCTDLLPPGDSPLSCRLLSLVQEAASWLRHNACEESHGSDSARSKAGEDSELGNCWQGWLQEAEVVDDAACLTVFRWGERRLARVLFREGGRMDFDLEAKDLLALERSEGDFRLVTAAGAALRRRFAEPLGAGAEVELAARLLRNAAPRLGAAPSALGAESPVHAACVAEAALRRTELCLLGSSL